MRKRLGWAMAWSVSLCLLTFCPQPGTANDAITSSGVGSNSAATATTPTASAGSSSATADSAAALKGNIKAEDLSIITAVKELGEICHHMKSAATDLLYESQRPHTVAIGGPLIAGNTAIPVGPAPGGVMNMGGYLPPRKKWLDYYVNQVSFLFPLLETQITSASSPDNDPTASAVIADMKVQLAQIKPWYDRLVSDTKAPPYNNANITKDASAIITYADRIDKDRKQLDSIAKKAEKKAAKLEKRHQHK